MKRERASGRAFAPWNETPSGRERPSDKVGRFATGRKGKRRVVVAHGILVRDAALEAESHWWKEKGEGMKPSPSRHYGTGATVYDTERRLGLTLPDSARVAGQRQKAHNAPTAVYAESRVPVLVTREDGTVKYTVQTVRYATGETVDRPHRSKPSPLDRVAREMVQAANKQAKRETAQQRTAKIIRRMRKAAVGR